MSIRQIWEKRVREGELFRLEFLIAGGLHRRIVLLSPEMNDLVSEPWENDEMGHRRARLRADLENIMAGERLVVCWTPGKARQRHQIGRLEPLDDNIFDIRSSNPAPGLRVLFHFAEKDVLVAHLCSPRSHSVRWLARPPLAERSSKAWRRAIAESNQNWSVLFPRHSPHNGSHIDDYLSNAILS